MPWKNGKNFFLELNANMNLLEGMILMTFFDNFTDRQQIDKKFETKSNKKETFGGQGRWMTKLTTKMTHGRTDRHIFL